MEPTDPNLAQILVDMYASGQPATRARGENFIFEERVGQDRQIPYETDHAPAKPSYRVFLASHKRYVKKSVYIEEPETFKAINEAAALPALMGAAAGNQYLIRMECLDFVLTHSIFAGGIADLDHILAVYRGDIRDPLFTQADAKAKLEKVCQSLNANPHAVRPRFAAFAQDLDDDIDAPDWAERLRDRLGLPHYPNTAKYGSHPVALMRYTVGEVAKRAAQIGADYAVTVPTVLDAEPYEVFHPAPRETTYGRTLNLAGDSECARLASEVLHPRIDYAPTHFLKVGAITRKTGLTPNKLTKLREDHRFCLQYLSGRHDFGKV